MFWRIPYSYPQKTIQKLNSGDNSLIISRMQNIKKKPESMRGEGWFWFLFFDIYNIKKKESRFSYRHMKKKKIFEKVLSAFTSYTIQGKCDKTVMKS